MAGLPFGDAGDSDYYRKLLAKQLMGSVGDTSPVQHWSQGANRVLQAALLGQMGRQDREERKEYDTELLKFLNPPPAASTAMPTTPLPSAVAKASSPNGRTYDQSEFNPLDAAVATPKELAAGVDSYVPDQYKPTVGKAEVDQDLPKGMLARLLRQESGFSPDVISGKRVSSAGAQGIAQFLPSTARGMGVDPLNPESAIPGAAVYLRQGLDAHAGDPRKAAAYYHGGPDTSQWGPKTAAYANAVGGQQYAQANIPGQPPMPQQQAQPDLRGQIQQMMQHPNPKIRDLGRGMLMQQVQQQLKPTDYDFKPRDDGSIVAINKRNPQDVRVIQPPGGPQALVEHKANTKAAETRAELQAKKDFAAPDQRKQEVRQGAVVIDEIDRAIKLIDTSKQPTTGMLGGQLLANVGGTDAHTVANLISTIQANVGFDQLNKMRQSSPTGAALGAITKEELGFLQAVVGSVRQSQNAEELKYNLNRLKKAYEEVIHTDQHRGGSQGQGSGEGGWTDLGGGVRIREKR